MSKINKKVKLHQKTNWKSLNNEDLEKEYNPAPSLMEIINLI